ncbi:MAG: hypothetical protein COX46_00490 [bacterium (Candidatus Ratteibacteria) CG23_combo_of_CG06-09_8_20_14_all_48_7]|uniref:Putative zinc-finger domain-containing protein n=1 Tax=bacterium (Candidatus Ratteibacteria) CG23_combo_of_CG06-09_8_20_14_all_48_7 TaxID=2014292 RepID=A0A2G9YBX0_9BACT|nr:MAG: hypothetical protein COX46_00490 [bacterium (Candidatus Ratteibacteria) CG23_combo_of_CG06-09_8_20_14_all_48_7]
MDCKNKKIMLSAYRDGELSEEERREIEKHLKACSVCTEELKEIQKLSSLIKEVPEIKTSPQFEDRLKERLNITPELVMLKQLSRTMEEIEKKVTEYQKKAYPEIMTIEDLSFYLQISIETIWASLREIPSFRVGDQLRFRKGSVDEWIGRKETPHLYYHPTPLSFEGRQEELSLYEPRSYVGHSEKSQN